MTDVHRFRVNEAADVVVVRHDSEVEEDSFFTIHVNILGARFQSGYPRWEFTRGSEDPQVLSEAEEDAITYALKVRRVLMGRTR